MAEDLVQFDGIGNAHPFTSLLGLPFLTADHCAASQSLTISNDLHIWVVAESHTPVDYVAPEERDSRNT